MVISVDSIGWTQDGMRHFPLGTHCAGSPGAGPTTNDLWPEHCKVTLRLPADAHRKASVVNNLRFAHAIFLSLPISSPRSHVRPTTRRLGVGLFLLASFVGAGTGRHACYSTPVGTRLYPQSHRQPL